MFGIGGFELFLILIFGFLIFGPDKLPQIANTIGRAIAKFRTAQEDMKGQLNMESFMDKESDEPFKNPLEVIETAADQAKSASEAARAKADEATDKVIEHTESFAERKARYDRERKARKEAEARAREAAEAEAKAKAEADPRTDVPSKTAIPAEEAGSGEERASEAIRGTDAGSASKEVS